MKRSTLIVVGLGLVGLYLVMRQRQSSSLFSGVPGNWRSTIQGELNRQALPSWVDDTRTIIGI